MNYRFWWAVLFVGLMIAFVPGFFWAGAELFNESAGVASDVVGEAYDDVAGNEPVSHGRERIVEIMVGFEVNDDYHGWGQWLASYHQLPEITGAVYAARMIGREERTTLTPAGLRAQLRLNWDPLRRVADGEPNSRVCRNFVNQTGQRLRSTGCMVWTGIRVRVGERSTHLCVDLHEATEGHNILGTVQDGLHWVHWNDWHLSDGDRPASHACTALTNNGDPLDTTRAPYYRPGESEPTGWLSIRFVGARPDDLVRTPRDEGFGTPTFPQPH